MLPALIISGLYCLELLKYWLIIGGFAKKKIRRKWIGILGLVVCIRITSIKQIGQPEIELIMYFLVYSIVAVSMEAKVKEKISLILMSILLMSCAESILGIPIEYIFQSKYDKWESISISLLMLIFILIIIYLRETKKIQNSERCKEFIKKHVGFFMLLLSVFLAFTIGGLNFAKERLQDIRFTILVNAISTVSFVCIGLIAWIMLYVNDKNTKMEETIRIERRLKNMQISHYKNMLQREVCTRRFRHDMNNHFICLNELIKTENFFIIEEYIKDMQKQMLEIKEKIYMVGNEIIDALLNHHLSNLKYDTKIEINGFCTNEITVSNVDLCKIFGNIFQNSVEELNRSENRNGYFKMNIKVGEQFTKIEIKNSISSQSLKKTNLLKSNKKNKLNHGLGLKNIKETVEKNEGNFEIEIKGNEFIVRVILNNLKKI